MSLCVSASCEVYYRFSQEVKTTFNHVDGTVMLKRQKRQKEGHFLRLVPKIGSAAECI
jgi:hypothetical protein